MEINFKPTLKQAKAYKYLTDHKTRFVGFGGGVSGGKAQPLSAIIYTPFGKKTMGDMKVGSVISHPSGINTNVIAIHPQGIKDIYEVTFKDGGKTRVTKEHLWFAWKGSNRSKQEKEEKGKIYSTMMLKKIIDKKKYSMIIPVTKPIQFTLPSNYKNKIHPYIIGALIGDGCLTNSITFTSADKEIVDKIQNNLTMDNIIIKTKSKYAYSIKCRKHTTNKKGYPINPFKEELKKIGLYGKNSKTKRIPKYLFTASIKDRFELLQGLMDTDGTVRKNGACSYCSVGYGLINDVQEIARSLGARTNIIKKKTNQGLGYAYVLSIKMRDNSKMFYLPRKKERCLNANYNDYEFGRSIKSIELVGQEEAQCITVDNKDGLYITDDFIITHNSYLGCFWLLSSALAYPRTQWLMGRRELTNLKKTTLLTFFKLVAELGLNPEDHFTLDGQNNIIKFKNGSKIFLMDMAYKPSDPHYLRFGGLEIVGAFLDESNEMEHKAIEIISSRIGRSGANYGLTPKILETFNPSKNHVYTRYYSPWKEHNLDDFTVFIPALFLDNPYNTEEYIETLNQMTEVEKQRLLYGNFDYDDDDRALCSFDKIKDVFTNTYVKKGKSYIVSDLAMKGRDKFVVTSWNGLRCSFDIVKGYSEAKEIEEDLKKEAEKHSVPRSSVIADSDGLGSYLESYMKGIKEFHGGSKAKDTDTFKNIKGECAFKLAELINKGEIFIDVSEDREVKIKGKYRKLRQVIIEELGQLKRDNLDRDEAKKILISKDEMKKNIGRSPDFLDCLIMRMYFEVNKISFRAVAG